MVIANASRPMGFIPYNMGGRANPIITPRPVAAARAGTNHNLTNDDLAVGDAYTLDANGNAHRAGSTGGVDPVHGIVIGFKLAPNPTVAPGPLSQDYLPQAQAGTILGCEDPAARFVVQANTFAVTNRSGKFDLADAVPDPTFRQSRQTLTTTNPGTNFLAEDITPESADNTYGANATVLVRLLNTINN